MTPTQDLSRQHDRLTGWFRSSAIPWRPEWAEAFQADGFVGPVPAAGTPEELEAVRQAADGVMARLEELEPRLYEVEQGHRDRPDEVVCHFLGGWMVDPVLHDLVFHEDLARTCAGLLGVDELRFWHDQVFAKPPRHPGMVPWHQDYSYWQRTGPACHITVHIALDDADEENGCLHYVPGSHRLGLLPAVPFDGDVDHVRAHLPSDFDWRPVPMRLRAGEAVIHHSHVLHGSFANRSDRPRRAAVLNYMGAHVRALTSEALLRGTDPQVAGETVRGRWFPRVL